MNDEERRKKYVKMDIMEFKHFLGKLGNYWGIIKMMEIDNPDNHDITFIKELVYIIEQVGIPIDVMARHKNIHPGYVLEKLNNADRILKSTISYFEGKIEKDG